MKRVNTFVRESIHKDYKRDIHSKSPQLAVPPIDVSFTGNRNYDVHEYLDAIPCNLNKYLQIYIASVFLILEFMVQQSVLQTVTSPKHHRNQHTN
jgi:hypothetical protein